MTTRMFLNRGIQKGWLYVKKTFLGWKHMPIFVFYLCWFVLCLTLMVMAALANHYSPDYTTYVDMMLFLVLQYGFWTSFGFVVGRWSNENNGKGNEPVTIYQAMKEGLWMMIFGYVFFCVIQYIFPPS